MLKLRYLVLPCLVVAAAQACGAGSDDPNNAGGQGGASSSTGGTGINIDPGTGGSSGGTVSGLETGVILTPSCTKDCTVFSSTDGSEALVLKEGVSDSVVSQLDSVAATAGNCITEPTNGTMFPAGWTRPRFNYTGATGAHKITLSAPRMRHKLTIYTSTMPYVLPQDIWVGLSKTTYNEDITYTVKSTSGAESTGTFQIAPVAVGGSMVFWGSTTTTPGPTTNALYGFSVGEEGVISALAPGDYAGVAIQDNANLRTEYTTTSGQSVCVGCHASTPDGTAVATVDHWEWNIRVGGIEESTKGKAPSFLTSAGAAIASVTWLGAPTFSAADWNSGARRMITSWGAQDVVSSPWNTHSGGAGSIFELVWMNLASTGTMPVDLRTATPANYTNDNQALQKAVAALYGKDWKVLSRTGDSRHAVMADWSHDGKNVVYTSADKAKDGRIDNATVVDLYTVPFGDGSGGTAAPVSGAATTDYHEYYPDYSPDDSVLAFNRVKVAELTGNPEIYYLAQSDIYVIPAAGGTPTRLNSNDPACGTGTRGQVHNSWAKWAPESATDGELTYYFLIFSTSRNSPFNINGAPASQLYMTTVIKKKDGSFYSSPAIFLWNQTRLVTGTGDQAKVTELLTNNVTPAWDAFKIPSVPDVVVK